MAENGEGDMVRAAADHPLFHRINNQRRRVSTLLCLLLLVIYGVYVGGMAFWPAFMKQPLWPGALNNWGIVLALAVVVGGALISGIYTWWANSRLDRWKRELAAEIGHED